MAIVPGSPFCKCNWILSKNNFLHHHYAKSCYVKNQYMVDICIRCIYIHLIALYIYIGRGAPNALLGCSVHASRASFTFPKKCGRGENVRCHMSQNYGWG